MDDDADLTFPAIANEIPDEAAAYEFLEKLRWGGEATECPHAECGATNGAYYIRPADGKSRKTRTGASSQRRVWKCRACRKQFSVLTGTVFHGTRISVRTIVFVVFEVCSSKNGIAAREVARKYGITPRSAWFLLHRIREAMKIDPVASLLSGVVVADETCIGGLEKNKHRQGTHGKPKYGPGGTGRPVDTKSTVLSLIDTDTGEVRSLVVNDVTGHTLRKKIAEQVDMAATVLMTDEYKSYRQVGPEMTDHRTVNHSVYEYVRHDADMTVTTNQVEGYFSQLKRSIDGTHHAVSSVHLPRYLAHFDYMYTTRGMTDSRRMRRLMGQVGNRRLSYRPLTDR